ncbi:MAG: branched-chain amino acid transport [Enterovirga sp.]|nr:branched-chain amino acid transport [Enterovirga sp.]
MTPAEAGAIPYGAVLAIAAMTLATYLCRSSGVVLMSWVRITPRVQRALAALPGSIVVATVVPIAARSGPDGILGILVGLVVMRLVRNELAALCAGLAVAAAVRALAPHA